MSNIKRISVFPGIFIEINNDGGISIFQEEINSKGNYIPPKQLNLDPEVSRELFKEYKKFLMEDKLKNEETDEEEGELF